MKKQTRHLLMLLLAAFLWGTTFVAQSLGAELVGPFTYLMGRSWIAVVVLLPVIAVRARAAARNGGKPVLPQTPAQRKQLALGGLVCGSALCMASASQQLGMANASTAKAGFITALYVVLVPIAGLAFGRKPRWWVWLSVAMSAAGLWLLCMTGAEGLSLGDSLVLLCALAFTGHILCADHFSPLVDGVKLSCIQFFTCGVLSFIPMLLEHPNLGAILSAAMPILYAGVLSSGVAYTLQIVAQKDTDPTVASLILCLESVFAVLAGALVLHQIPTGRELAGCVLMFVAIVLAQRE